VGGKGTPTDHRLLTGPHIQLTQVVKFSVTLRCAEFQVG